MQMQEPEQWQSSRERQWQEDQPYGAYNAEDLEKYEQRQQQKVYPQGEQKWKGAALVRIVIVLSWIACFLTIPVIIASANILKYAHDQPILQQAGVTGLVCSILVLVMFLTIFILSAVTLAKGGKKRGISH